jgi:DNA invertase Pin-like site-specific DNA recombinase
MPQPRAYSYIRFSTPKQQWGDSRRRQLKKTRDYADKKGFDLDESLTLEDLGLSAYHGVHVEKGALGVFLEAVRDGKVPRGAFLIVENLDRLSRQKPRLAMRNFLDLIDAGITIITLTNEKEHSAKSVDDDPDSLASSLGEMIRAHRESERKAELLGPHGKKSVFKLPMAERSSLVNALPGWNSPKTRKPTKK